MSPFAMVALLHFFLKQFSSRSRYNLFSFFYRIIPTPTFHPSTWHLFLLIPAQSPAAVPPPPRSPKAMIPAQQRPGPRPESEKFSLLGAELLHPEARLARLASAGASDALPLYRKHHHHSSLPAPTRPIPNYLGTVDFPFYSIESPLPTHRPRESPRKKDTK